MGTSRGRAELSRKIAKVPAAMAKDAPNVADAVARNMKSEVEQRTRRDLGSDMAFTGSGGGRPKRVRVRTKREGSAVLVKATGPMHWLEGGVKPHVIVSKKFGRTRSTKGGRRLKGGGLSEAKLGTTDFVSQAFGFGARSVSFGTGRNGALAFADGNFRPYARRAGKFPAKRTWSEGVRAGARDAEQVAAKQVRANLFEVFK